MKKLLLIITIALFSFGAMAQTATEILAKYNKATGLDKVDTNNVSFMSNVEAARPQGDMSVKLIAAPGSKYRAEISSVGQNVLAVMDGDNAWLKAPQGTQKVHKEALAAIIEVGNILNLLKMEQELFDFIYEGEKDGLYIVKATPKVGANTKGVKEATHYFDKTTGLNTKSIATVEMEGQTIKTESKTTGHKKFGDLTVPTSITVEANGHQALKMSILDVELDYPTAAWMFAEPK